MNRRRRLWAILAAAALALCVPMAQARLPRSFDLRPVSDQSQLFGAVLHEAGIRPITQWQSLLTDPSSKMLIVLGANDILDREWPGDQLREFLAGGGSLLLASDQKTSEHLSGQIGARIAGVFFQSPPHASYRGIAECPLLGRFQPRHALFRDLPANAVVATNRPSRISDWWPPVEPVAIFAVPGHNIHFPRFVSDQQVLAVAAERQSGSRVLVIADHSIFINGMMQQADNDNIQFAYSAIQWLSENGKRKEALFTDGRLQNDFSIMHEPPRSPALPPIEMMMPRLNDFIRKLERENVVNKAILQAVPHATILRTAALVITLAAMAAGIVRFLSSRRRFPAKVSVKSAESHSPPDLRFGEAGRELALQLYGELGRWDPRTSAMPAIAVRGSASLRREWARRHASLWSVAAGRAAPQSASNLRQLHAEALALRDAVGSGVVHFPPEP